MRSMVSFQRPEDRGQRTERTTAFLSSGLCPLVLYFRPPGWRAGGPEAVPVYQGRPAGLPPGGPVAGATGSSGGSSPINCSIEAGATGGRVAGAAGATAGATAPPLGTTPAG